MQLEFTPLHRGGSGPPLLLLHGFTDTWRTWELVLPLLEPRRDVLAPTLAGHTGGPPADDPPTATSLVETVERLLDDAELEAVDVGSAATSRCSSPRAAARAASSRSHRRATRR